MSKETRHLVDTSEAAARLGVHPATVKRWVKAGKLRALKGPGRHYRFDVADLDAAFSEYVPDGAP